MITAGIDVGTGSIKVLILDGDRVLSKARLVSGLEESKAIESAFDEAVSKAGISHNSVEASIATGAGAKNAFNVQEIVTDITSAARGTFYLIPQARTVIDVGSEQARAVKCNENGDVMDFATNEKCAAGAGAFIEAMARAVETDFDQFVSLHFESDRDIPLNAQCAVFAESEVVSLINSDATTADISRAINRSIGERTSSMTRRIGLEEKIVLIGGVALNAGFVDSLGKFLKMEIVVPEDPIFVNALGAALIGQQRS
ncbi:MAG: acyl-CoA dehydratase activase [Thermodesulfobacteriota bacterium]|nr:acyl-CoA dehydratase activase [Thermodesulfobacteriota bacterium]